MLSKWLRRLRERRAERWYTRKVAEYKELRRKGWHSDTWEGIGIWMHLKKIDFYPHTTSSLHRRTPYSCNSLSDSCNLLLYESTRNSSVSRPAFEICQRKRSNALNLRAALALDTITPHYPTGERTW